MAKKRKGKYPNLDKGKNLKTRADYIEPDYVNGVKDSKGEYVIRPLTNEEKTWLNQFYGEYIAVSDRYLNPTPEIEELMNEKSKLKKENKKIKKEKGYTNKAQAESDSKIKFNLKRISYIEEALDFLREEAGVLYPTCDEQRALYGVNNTRNACLFNNRKARGMLLELTEFTVDSFVAQYWDILSSFEYDSQDAIIDIVEERLREQGYLGKEAEYFGNAGSDTDDSGDEE